MNKLNQNYDNVRKFVKTIIDNHQEKQQDLLEKVRFLQDKIEEFISSKKEILGNSAIILELKNKLSWVIDLDIQWLEKSIKELENEIKRLYIKYGKWRNVDDMSDENFRYSMTSILWDNHIDDPLYKQHKDGEDEISAIIRNKIIDRKMTSDEYLGSIVFDDPVFCDKNTPNDIKDALLNWFLEKGSQEYQKELTRIELELAFDSESEIQQLQSGDSILEEDNSELDLEQKDKTNKKLDILIDMELEKPNLLNLFRSDLGKYSLPPLEKEEEIKLFKRIRKNWDKEAVELIIRHNIRFLFSEARKLYNVYKHYNPKMQATLTEFVSEWYLWFYDSISRFEPNKWAKFISYAVHYIHRYIKNMVSETEGLILLGKKPIMRIPNNILSQHKKITKELEGYDLNKDMARKSSYDSHLDWSKSESDLYDTLEALPNLDDDLEDVDTLPSAIQTDKLLLQESLRKDLYRTLNILTSRESDILNLHFGLFLYRDDVIKEKLIAKWLSNERSEYMVNIFSKIKTSSSKFYQTIGLFIEWKLSIEEIWENIWYIDEETIFFLKSLSDEEKQIIASCNLWFSERPSLKEIWKKFWLTRERTMEIESKAVRRLKQTWKSKLLSDYVW